MMVCLFSAAYMTKSLIVDTNTIKFEIWDTAGQERVSLVSCCLEMSLKEPLSIALKLKVGGHLAGLGGELGTPGIQSSMYPGNLIGTLIPTSSLI